MERIKFSDIKIESGFWAEKQKMVRENTLWAVYDRFLETGRFDALGCTWKEGEKNKPHFYWDSDIAKWIEGAAYVISQKEDKALEEIIDNCVNLIEKNSDENGYFNCHFLVTRQKERFTHRDDHELYCAGHLIEAAVAYYEATGKDKLLKAMQKYADYIERVFKIEKSAAFTTCGHPEIELALVRLYNATGEKRYLELSKYFIDEHGNGKDKSKVSGLGLTYNQDNCLLRDREEAEGHCVRALYLFCAVADIARLYKDDGLLNACRKVFDDIVNKKMYITGGVGSTAAGEAFTVGYDLPNRTAYTETCAAISLAMFSGRMQLIEPKSKYADVIERVLYNGFLSGVSMDGKSFFYENPLEIDLGLNDERVKVRYPLSQRKAVFECSCCPPNVVRFISSVADYMYTYDEETVYIHQYMESVCHKYGITLHTSYPSDGEIKISYKGDKKYIAVRIPYWCKEFKIDKKYEIKDGYAFIKAERETEINISFDMSVTIVKANRRVHENAGRVAVMRGPVVYCLEGIDNGADLKSVRLDTRNGFTLGESKFMLPSIRAVGYRETESEELYMPYDNTEETVNLEFIPYYAFANRGDSDMIVWILR